MGRREGGKNQSLEILTKNQHNPAQNQIFEEKKYRDLGISIPSLSYPSSNTEVLKSPSLPPPSSSSSSSPFLLRSDVDWNGIDEGEEEWWILLINFQNNKKDDERMRKGKKQFFTSFIRCPFPFLLRYLRNSTVISWVLYILPPFFRRRYLLPCGIRYTASLQVVWYYYCYYSPRRPHWRLFPAKYL